MKLTEHQLTVYLKRMVHKHPNTIEVEVAHWLFNRFEPVAALTDFLTNGFSSDRIVVLKFVSDTHAFFDKYYRQINQIYYDTGVRVPPQVDVKDWLARYAYREVVKRIAVGASVM